MNRARYLNLFRCGVLLLQTGVSYSQTAQPTESFVVSMQPRVAVVDSTLLKSVNSGNKQLTCDQFVSFLQQISVLPDKSRVDKAFLVHAFEFQRDDAVEQSHAWYSFNLSWYDGKEKCRFSSYDRLRDPGLGNRFRDQRLWGKTNLEVVSVLGFSGVQGIKIAESFINSQNAIGEALAAADPGKLKDLCDFVADHDKEFPLTSAACKARAGEPTQKFGADRISAVAGEWAKALADSFGEKPFPFSINFVSKGNETFVIEGKETKVLKPGSYRTATACGGSCNIVVTPANPQVFQNIFPAKLSYQLDVTKTIPDNQQNLQAALSQGNSLSTGAAQAGTPIELNIEAESGAAVLVGSQDRSITLTPSSVKATGAAVPPKGQANGGNGGSNNIALGSATFDNEGRYWWNVSAVIPIRNFFKLASNNSSKASSSKSK
jgi:hypothetical protein